MTPPQLVEGFFRHEYGRLVAILVRRVGTQDIEAVEDAVQSALLTALDTWTVGGLPDNPSAWLFRVPSNKLIGEFRQQTRRRLILEQNAVEFTEVLENDPGTYPADEVHDDLLHMLFVCCDEAIPPEAQLVLATVAQRYCLRLVPGHPVEPQVLLTMRPRHGLPMTLHNRLRNA